ncbi:hypothetical protein ACHAXR_007464 [Thalassiosira sp. AJA248-18]
MKYLPTLFFAIVAFVACDAFAPAPHRKRTKAAAIQQAHANEAVTGEKTREKFLGTLDRPYDLNTRSELRTQLLNDVIANGAGLPNPGSQESFGSVAPGSWRVCYAPHMTIMAGLFQGELSVQKCLRHKLSSIYYSVSSQSQYDMKEDGTIISHARYKFPSFNLYGYLSVSGTYGSVNNQVCRVDFDEAWMRTLDNDSFEQDPFSDIESVPDSISKALIRNIGNSGVCSFNRLLNALRALRQHFYSRALFIEPFAVFPVSYLDNELIVFDFELLGTRICARKES